MISYETIHGTVTLSNEYMTKLIGQAVTSCFGVVGMVPYGSKQKILGLVSKKEYIDRGISVKDGMDGVDIELHIIVSYGMNINAIAKSIVIRLNILLPRLPESTLTRLLLRLTALKNNLGRPI